MRRVPSSISAVLLTACALVGTGRQGVAAEAVAIDGSSTVYPISEAVGEEFQKENPKTRVTIGIAGTGGGFQRFCAGEIDIADASRAIKPTEADACKAKSRLSISPLGGSQSGAAQGL